MSKKQLKNELLELLKEKILGKQSDNFDWAGWKSERGDSQFFEYQKGTHIVIVGVRTWFEDHGLKLTIRRFAQVNRVSGFNYKELDPEKHDFLYKMDLTNELNKLPILRKNEFCWEKGESEIEQITYFFQKAVKKAVFTEDKNQAPKEKLQPLLEILKA